MRSVLILIAMAGAARADALVGSSEGGFTLLQHFSDMRPVTALPTSAAPDPTITQLGLFGVRVGLMPSDPMVAEHVAFDFAIGGQVGRHGGFAYDVALMPLGLGARFGADSFLALDTGIAAMGATGSLDDAILVPIQLQLEYGTGYHLMVRARDSFVFGADGRKDGAPSLPIGDELEGTLAVRIDKAKTTLPEGYFLGVAYKEMLGTRYIGLSLGYSVGSNR